MTTKKAKTRAKAKPSSKSEESGPGGVPIREMPRSFDFLKSIQIWQGPPKTGKTSTAAALKDVAEGMGLEGVDPFFMLFEPGSGGVAIKGTSQVCECGGKKSCPECEGAGVKRLILSEEKEISDWFDWAAKSDCNPIVIDTGDAMFQAVADYVCVRLGIGNPSQADHGIAWVQIFDEMRMLISTITSQEKALIIIMHVHYQEKRVKGGSIQTATFNVSGKTRPYLAGLANQILHFGVVPDGDGDKHTIATTPTAGVEAGDHWELFPDELDRGDSPESGAEAILGCFYEVE